MRVLVADDCRDTRRLVETLLATAGYDITVVDDGAQAWNALQTGEYPLAILDWMMPGFSGPQICELISKSDQIRHVYVIILTGKHEHRDLVNAMEAGASDFISKPFTKDELIARLKVGERTVAMTTHLAHAQKLESIGQLAAGISHEINTPIQFIGDNTTFLDETFSILTALIARIDALLPQIAAGDIDERLVGELRDVMKNISKRGLQDEIPAAIKETLEGIKHVSHIVQSMKKFAHPGTEKKESIDLNDAIENAVTVTRNEWKYAAEMVTQLDSSLPLVFCHVTELNQVFVNLIINAAHAITEKDNGKGVIRMETSCHGDQVEIRVSDTGTGIPKEVQAKIFDPFFTTKSVGIGTGQGLAIAWDVVVGKHFGTLTVASEVGEGTTFTIRIPAGTQPMSIEARATPRKQKILFVDDQKSVLNGLRRMLLGLADEWDMEFAESGEEALEKMGKSSVDVIVTDMRMPGMDGAELLEHVKTRHPNTVRVVLSGQTDQEGILRSVGLAHQFLNKPCDVDTLRSTIAQTFKLQCLLSQEPLKEIVASLTTIPSVPTLYQQIQAEAARGDSRLSAIGSIIAQDPAMTAKILQLANSGFFAQRRRFSHPAEAVVMLGLEATRSLVLLQGVFAQFDGAHIEGYSVGLLAEHGIAVAAFAKAIAEAEEVGKSAADACYLAGMVHNVGQLVLAANCADKFGEAVALSTKEQIPLYEAEIRIFDSSHADVGAYLLGLWGLPFPVVEAVAYHHNPSACGATSFSPLTAVYAAKHFVYEMGIAKSTGTAGVLDEEYLRGCGLDNCLDRWQDACHNILPQGAVA